jgi:2-polyprenyl-3-methyl-5-hydroxy-6-metoxy-1,4-benzoquinol methylase
MLPAVHAKSRETNSSALRVAILRKVGRRFTGTGEIFLPCAPSLLEPYMEKFQTLFEVLGKPFTEEEIQGLRQIVQTKLEQGWHASPFSHLTFGYQTKPPPHPGVQYVVNIRVVTMEEHYNGWVDTRQPPLFGKFPDAKLVDLAATLGPAARVPVLDVGAGTGRNTLPMARLGHPTDAVEPVQKFADILKEEAKAQKFKVGVIVGNILDPALKLKKGHYKLIVMADVIASHFTEVDQIRRAFTTLGDALAPGGILLVSTFLGQDGYKPDPMARQVSQLVWSCIFTQGDFAVATQKLPLDLVSDESSFEYEKNHLPAEGWPPTGWFADWARGRDVFAVPRPDMSPIDLRWLTYQRR